MLFYNDVRAHFEPVEDHRRPAPMLERWAAKLFHAFAPPIHSAPPRAVPESLSPAREVSLPRRHGKGRLSATWFPAHGGGAARGAVLLVCPWTPWGQSYFHRSGRIEALREAGYHAMTFDVGGHGKSGPPPRGFFDRDLEDALDGLRVLAGDTPIHLWGTSFGGYWAHLLLSRRDDVAGAVFEDVPRHLIEWSKAEQPKAMPAYLFFQNVFAAAYRYIDVRLHAPRLRAKAVAYIGGGRDEGVPAEETREHAQLAGGDCMIVPGARHLGAIRAARQDVITLALATFARAAA